MVYETVFVPLLMLSAGSTGSCISINSATWTPHIEVFFSNKNTQKWILHSKHFKSMKKSEEILENRSLHPYIIIIPKSGQH